MTNGFMKVGSTSLATRKVQTKTTRYHYTTIRMIKIFILTIPRAGKSVEQSKLVIFWRETQNGKATV